MGAIRSSLRLLSAPRLVGLGRFSYSLYLTHLPVVALLYFLVQPWPLGPVDHVLVLLAFSTPVSLGTAYGFHVLVERPFTPGQRDRSAQPRRAA